MQARDASTLQSAVFDALSRGATVVVPGRHAAQALRRRHNQTQDAAGLPYWTPPAIRSWPGLLEEMWRDQQISGVSSHLLLNDDQEQLLWQRIIAADDARHTPAGAWKLAELAQAAWRLLCTYRVRTGGASPARPSVLRQLLDDSALDTRTFARWAIAFEERCLRDRMFPVAELPERLAIPIAKGLYTPKHTAFTLVGFDEPVPARDHFLDMLRGAGVPIDVLEEDPGEQGASVLIKTDDADEEIQVCAKWCVQQSQAGSRVAVVSAELEQVRPALTRALRSSFAAERRRNPVGQREAQPFGFGVGVELRREPVVRTAISILRLAAGPLPIHEASELLQSPCFAGEDTGRGPDVTQMAGFSAAHESSDSQVLSSEREWAARARLDAFDLRTMKRLQPEATLRDLRALADASDESPRLVRLRQALRAVEKRWASSRVRHQSFGRWAELMRALLRAGGWSAAQESGSPAERAPREAMDGVLDALAALDFSGERVSYADALATVLHLVDKRTIAADADSAHVAIHAPEDTAGMQFDAVWCLGAGEISWPAQRLASALVPRTMQRTAGMPGVDRAQEAAFLSRVFRRLRRVAPHSVFSYPEHTGTGSQRAVSPLRGASTAEVPAGVLVPDKASIAGSEERKVLEKTLDEKRIAPLPAGTVYGGAGLLEKQAACGFRALAEYRLFSSALETPELGADPRRTGDVVHLAMRWLWDQLKDHAGLLNLSGSARSEAVLAAIDSVLAGLDLSNAPAWGSAFVRVERERLRRLLESWLDLEKNRPAFWVEGHELPLENASIGPLHLRLRVDRVDRVDGKRVVIDYKTSDASSRDWEGDRPDAPQLPLYALLADNIIIPPSDREEPGTPAALGGIAFARVRRPRMALDGVAAGANLLSGVASRRTDLDGRLLEWATALESLAWAFATGDARVDPKHFPETCKRCKQRMLCRLDSGALQEEESFDFDDYA